jgi:hypothetical protein
LKTSGGKVLSGDLSVLKQVRKESACYERELARESHIHQVRSRAKAAFREENYARAAVLYESIEEDLSPVESRKLGYSRKRTRTPGSRES